jgi:hypothetical protein
MGISERKSFSISSAQTLKASWCISCPHGITCRTSAKRSVTYLSIPVMEAATVADILNFLYVVRNSVAQVGEIKAFLTNLAAFVWPDSLRLFIDNLYIAVLSLSYANSTSTISLCKKQRQPEIQTKSNKACKSGP